MATVTGTLNDFSLSSLASYSPRIIFTASEPAASPARLLSTRPVTVTPAASGAFTVELHPTTQLRPAGVHYTIRIEWLDADGGFVGVDIAGWKLFVPDSGGDITDLTDASPGSSLIWVGLVPPPGTPAPGQLWVVMNPLNPDDPANTGEIREWSA
jgi:hypothetical protein